MTCINWVRVRKGARLAGSRLEIEQPRTITACMTGELVDFSTFVCLVLLLFYQEIFSRPKFKEEREFLGFFSFLYHGVKRKPRVQLCDVRCGSGPVEAAVNHWTSMTVEILVRMFVKTQLTNKQTQRDGDLERKKERERERESGREREKERERERERER